MMDDGDGMGEGGYSHQQARLTTGTIAHNDQLSTDFRHVDEGWEGIEETGESEGITVRATRRGVCWLGEGGGWVVGGKIEVRAERDGWRWSEDGKFVSGCGWKVVVRSTTSTAAVHRYGAMDCAGLRRQGADMILYLSTG